MQMLEHDAKDLGTAYGIHVPAGGLLGDELPLPGPWVVKAQVPVGGRGKVGAIRIAHTPEEVVRIGDDTAGMTVRGHAVSAVRVEQAVGAGATEAYIALMLDPETGSVRVLASKDGGVEIESASGIYSVLAPIDQLERGIAEATEGLPAAIAHAAGRLAAMFVGLEATLIEVNPLFLLPDGGWVAGDMKLVTDDNALFRQPALKALLEKRAAVYPEVARKEAFGFDYVVLDAEGDVGLLTTGAGLSMMLVDELRAAGFRPYNFLDVRTGGMRGDPARLVQVLRWLGEGRNVKVVLVNIFAGITDLDEFAQLLLTARASVPELDVPFIVRLAGTNLDAAQRRLSDAGIVVVTELAEAIARL